MKRLNRNRLAMLASLGLDSTDQIKVEALWIKYETGIHTSVKKNGPRYTLDRYKACYILLRNKVLKLSTQPIPWCKVDSEGIPKPLWTLRPLIKGDRNHQRIALCIARSYELVKLPIDYHPKTIEEAPSWKEGTYQETSKDFKQFLARFTQKFKWYLGSLHIRDGYEPRVFTTLSRGPNGPAVACSHLDAKAVTTDINLYSAIRDLNSALQQDWITKWMEIQAKTVDGENKWITGRLGFTSEPGGKTRVFAIGDYWSQTSLKVIQDSLYNTLRSISTDATANQEKGFKTLLKECLGFPTYCFDLESASDRIPAEMQKYRLELLGGKKLGDAWHRVMTDRTFLIKTTGQSMRWRIGQPLGLLSSFPSFALWHHDIIQFAHDRCRRRNGLTHPKFFKDYRLLGDDVVIFNKEVADEYRALMDIIGLKINDNKSVYGDSKRSQIEFAKRLALGGKEMSSIKRNILQKSSIKHLLDLVDILIEREFILPDTGRYGLYPLFSSKEEILFNFMVWTRSSVGLPFEWDNPTLKIDRDTFENKLKEKRFQNLMEKTTELDRILGGSDPLDIFYNSASIPCNRRALGLGEGMVLHSPHFELHPLVWALNQTGLDMSNTLSLIWDEQSPDVAPVEYLPIVSSKSYFQTPKQGRKEYLSRIIIDLFNELANETKS